jgi:hypothetical protein
MSKRLVKIVRLDQKDLAAVHSTKAEADVHVMRMRLP